MQASRPRPQQNRTSCPNGWRGSVRSNSADRTTSQRIRKSKAARPHLCFIFFTLSWHFLVVLLKVRHSRKHHSEVKIISIFMVWKQREIFTSNRPNQHINTVADYQSILGQIGTILPAEISILFISMMKIFSMYCFVKIFYYGIWLIMFRIFLFCSIYYYPWKICINR